VTLRRRMAIHTGMMIVGVVLIGVVALWGVTGLRQDLSVALDANARLRTVYEVGFQLAQAKQWLQMGDTAHAATALNAALVKLDERAGDPLNRTGSGDDVAIRPVRDDLRAAQSNLAQGKPSDAQRSLDEVMANLASLATDARQTIVARQAAADAKHRGTLAFVIVLSSVVVVATIVVGARQYRSVLSPLARLSDAVRRMASGHLDRRLPTAGDTEFAQLAGNFNHMAGQLDDLYRSLEQRVAEKSKELVRSERLASVGYLAAGVAHEINNPLGIIAGYGERSLQHLRRGFDDATVARVEASLKVICDEAFRAKDITDRLLSLARPAPEGRTAVCVAKLAREVVNVLVGLGRFGEAKITVQSDDSLDADGSTTVIANAGELKQVILNLLLNALEASPKGHVGVRINRVDNAWVELSVQDNGRGMTAQTLDRVFEPFFSDRRGVESREIESRGGTGLGLSIAHAIIIDHGGLIQAHSDGPGRGSRFIIRLAAVPLGARSQTQTQ
jgi:signal transduction histidine kinase